MSVLNCDLYVLLLIWTMPARTLLIRTVSAFDNGFCGLGSFGLWLFRTIAAFMEFNGLCLLRTMAALHYVFFGLCLLRIIFDSDCGCSKKWVFRVLIPSDYGFSGLWLLRIIPTLDYVYFELLLFQIMIFRIMLASDYICFGLWLFRTMAFPNCSGLGLLWNMPASDVCCSGQ